MDRCSKRRRINLHVIGVLTLFIALSNGQTVIVNGPTAIEQGSNAVYTCERTGGTTPYVYTWTDISVVPNVNIFIAGGRSHPVNASKYVNFDVSENGGVSTMTITNTQIEDEGQYRCSEGHILGGDKELEVEVESTRTLTVKTLLESNMDIYEATCRAIGGRPLETITLMLDDEPAPCADPGEINPTSDPDLSSIESVCKFEATAENYGKTLKCVIGGHQVTDLNGEETQVLDMHSFPVNDIVTVQFQSLDPSLMVTCDIDAANQPTPSIRNYYIYVDDTLTHVSITGDKSVELTESEYDLLTEFKCVAGNYLGNTTSGKTTYDPTRSTTSEKRTTSHSSTEYGEETTPEPTCTPSGLSSGASAVIAVLAILLVASVTANIVQFILLRRRNKAEFDDSKKKNKGDVLNIQQELNDNVAYEMIQSGYRAYTELKPDSSHSFVIARENVTFFTRLGSIGRGNFGEVWKGNLRSKQNHLDVAIRQIPDRVAKSLKVLQDIKVIYNLSDQPNIVKCLGYCKEQGSILYEFISGGTLLTHLQTSGVQSQTTYSNLKPNGVRTDEGTLLNLAWQVAKGMQFLASKKIIHGALCAHNVLLGERKQCKIADFGLSSSVFGDVAKPTRWSSPETMVTGDKTTEGDIWSFGIVLWEIVTLGARPYPNMTFSSVQTEVAKGYQIPRPRHCAQEVYAVMTGCWEKEPKNRSNFDHILKSMERILEKTHSYLSLNDLDEGLYASTLDIM